MSNQSHQFLMISSHLHTLSEVTFPFTSCSLCVPPAKVIMCYVVKFTHTKICSLSTKQKKKSLVSFSGWMAGAAESDLVLEWTLVKGPRRRGAVWQPVIDCPQHYSSSLNACGSFDRKKMLTKRASSTICFLISLLMGMPRLALEIITFLLSYHVRLIMAHVTRKRCAFADSVIHIVAVSNTT